MRGGVVVVVQDVSVVSQMLAKVICITMCGIFGFFSVATAVARTLMSRDHVLLIHCGHKYRCWSDVRLSVIDIFGLCILSLVAWCVVYCHCCRKVCFSSRRSQSHVHFLQGDRDCMDAVVRSSEQ